MSFLQNEGAAYFYPDPTAVQFSYPEELSEMCGIAGWIDRERDLTRELPVLEKMRESLAHRGPDAAGMWVSPAAALVHRRLIVVDPQGGEQPMVRRRGERCCVITYNGELYNTRELRRELEALGHVFRGYSDTEVLLASYVEWGRECVARLNGIFAFAIWDEADQSLFLARDRLGVKPLFYCRQGNAFLFGSELKALLAHPHGQARDRCRRPGRNPGHGPRSDAGARGFPRG